MYRPARIDCIGSMTSTELFSTLILACLLSMGALLFCVWSAQRCYRSWQTSQVKKRMDAFETSQIGKIQRHLQIARELWDDEELDEEEEEAGEGVLKESENEKMVASIN